MKKIPSSYVFARLQLAAQECFNATIWDDADKMIVAMLCVGTS